MEVAVQHPAFTTRKLHVRTAGFLSGAKILVDGRVVDGKRGTYEIADNAGKTRQVRMRGLFVDPIPRLEIDGERIQLARPLTWYEYAWMGVPILLIFGGGALGALFGVGAVYSSSRIFRGERGVIAKYVLSALISIGSVTAFFILAGILHILVHGFPKQ